MAETLLTPSTPDDWQPAWSEWDRWMPRKDARRTEIYDDPRAIEALMMPGNLGTEYVDESALLTGFHEDLGDQAETEDSERIVAVSQDNDTIKALRACEKAYRERIERLAQYVGGHQASYEHRLQSPDEFDDPLLLEMPDLDDMDALRANLGSVEVMITETLGDMDDLLDFYEWVRQNKGGEDIADIMDKLLDIDVKNDLESLNRTLAGIDDVLLRQEIVERSDQLRLLNVLELYRNTIADVQATGHFDFSALQVVIRMNKRIQGGSQDNLAAIIQVAADSLRLELLLELRKLGKHIYAEVGIEMLKEDFSAPSIRGAVVRAVQNLH